MYQRELFIEQAGRQAEFLGEGCYSKAFKLSNGQVCKIGTNDATRNWLEFCMLMREQGKLMPLMPEVYQVTSCGEGGYTAIMECYTPHQCFTPEQAEASGHPYGVGWKIENKPGFAEVAALYLEYARGIDSGVDNWWCFSDLHNGNSMWCDRRGWVITDPSACGYKVMAEAPAFVLQ